MSGLEDLGDLEVILSPLMPRDRIYVMPEARFHSTMPTVWVPVPETPREEAIAIVHEGLAEEIAWLRAAGHRIVPWDRRDDPSWSRWMADERLALSVRNPSATL